ncbi:hypothetical protein ElyMa_004281000 [Elysia marginata]|uniref:Uncharacterized protein n=1 Tax=Elysia marginata TaxID=1093978 RepID=A0AAV4GVT8_9GAST|nr:hypothetical protein ElyMa_004281000 [Elysia marginata]
MLYGRSLALRIKHLMKSFLEGSKSDCDYSPIMEPDFEHGKPNSFSKLALLINCSAAPTIRFTTIYQDRSFVVISDTVTVHGAIRVVT